MMMMMTRTVMKGADYQIKHNFDISQRISITNLTSTRAKRAVGKTAFLVMIYLPQLFVLLLLSYLIGK